MAVYRMKDLEIGNVKTSIVNHKGSEKLKVKKSFFILAFYF